MITDHSNSPFSRCCGLVATPTRNKWFVVVIVVFRFRLVSSSFDYVIVTFFFFFNSVSVHRFDSFVARLLKMKKLILLSPN